MSPRDGRPTGSLSMGEWGRAFLLPERWGRGISDWFDPSHEVTPRRRFQTLSKSSASTAAFLVGFAAEARVARLSGWQVAIGGGSTEGAARETRRLIDAGATGIVSFGLAGGLDPALPAGALIVPEAVAADGRIWSTDPGLTTRLGGTTGHLCLGLDRVVASAAEKQSLGRETGAALVDMESGAVATVASEMGVPFAVLRAICDPADRVLPPAALVALDSRGRLAAARLARSILTGPGQILALMALARDAAVARRALRSRAIRLGSHGAQPQWVSPEGISAEEISPWGDLLEEIP
jgi:adenosylhomocysteine nucleosidase